jgi:hypothetical protein
MVLAQGWGAPARVGDIKLYGREVYVAFDSDVQTNPHVLKALIGLCEFLRSRGANA